MKATFIASAAALAFSAAFAASVPEAAAKPVPMCFKTGNGKHYLRVNRADGFLLANATSCSGDAVFMVEYGNLDPRRVPLVGPPVVMKAANGR